jgi:hypothetical protein
MPIIAKGSDRKSFAPAPEGTHQAVCVDILDKGMLPNKFKEGQLQHKIDIAWEIDETRDDGKRFVVFKRYTLSLDDRSNLRRDLQAWRGKPFTPAELAGFDVETVKGANCLVNILWNKSDDGTRTYANVMSVSPLVKGMSKIALKDYVRHTDEALSPVPPPSDDDGVIVEELTDDNIPF